MSLPRTAVLLAGGRGTRLAPYNTVFPKPMVPLGDRPILDIIVRQLVHHGFERIVIAVGYLAELIEAYFQSRPVFASGVEILFVREHEPLGTVGALALVPDLRETFLVMNGDILTTLDYTALLDFHRQHAGLLTIATHRREIKLDLGIMDVGEDHVLRGFQEKPTFCYPVSMGVYVYEPEVLSYVKPGQYLDFPHVVWQMLGDEKRITSYPFDGYWLDLGSHADYSRAQDEFEALKARLIPGDGPDPGGAGRLGGPRAP